jgi:hypothetical protein
MPGRPKKSKREETEKPKGKKKSKHGTIIKCSLCGNPEHNKSGFGVNPERDKKKIAHLKKVHKTTEVCLTKYVLQS